MHFLVLGCHVRIFETHHHIKRPLTEQVQMIKVVKPHRVFPSCHMFIPYSSMHLMESPSSAACQELGHKLATE